MTDINQLIRLYQDASDRIYKISLLIEIIKRGQLDDKFLEKITYEKLLDMENLLNISDRSYFREKDKLNIAIVGYKSDLVGKWDPTNTKSGLPGSEECTVYASEELAKLGHNIVIYMNPPDNSIWKLKTSNPQWLPEEEWNNPNNYDKYDLVLMWRRYDPDYGRKRGKYVFFWPHDSPHYSNNRQFPNFDGVCVLSKHHSNQLSFFHNYKNIPEVISGNGIVPEQFNPTLKYKNKYSIGYFSNYARGLAILISIWPIIRKEFPEATLHICYGRETWNTLPQSILNWIIQKIEEYKDMGVIEHGKIGHLELAKVMEETSVWAYPCNTNTETFCITAVKCQASGCIPVTTRIGALDETIHPDAPNLPVIQDNDHVTKYTNLLLSTLSRIKDQSDEDIKEERLKYIKFANNFSWNACVTKWLQLYDNISNKK